MKRDPMAIRPWKVTSVFLSQWNLNQFAQLNASETCGAIGKITRTQTKDRISPYRSIRKVFIQRTIYRILKSIKTEPVIRTLDSQ